MLKELKNLSKSILENVVNESESFSDVCRKLGFDPSIGHIRLNVERKIKRLEISVSHFERIRRNRYNKEELIDLINKCSTFKEILQELDLLPVQTNYTILKRKLSEYEIDYSKFIQKNRKDRTKYSKEDVLKAVSTSRTISESLSNLGMKNIGGNYITFHKLIKLYNISISHFDPNIVRNEKMNKNRVNDIFEYLIENSSCDRKNLKRRLYNEGFLSPICSICGQDENWKGIKISLILDHINGIHNDNRLENLRIVCPNCNAGLDTFSGRNNKNSFII